MPKYKIDLISGLRVPNSSPLLPLTPRRIKKHTSLILETAILCLKEENKKQMKSNNISMDSIIGLPLICDCKRNQPMVSMGTPSACDSFRSEFSSPGSLSWNCSAQSTSRYDMSPSRSSTTLSRNILNSSPKSSCRQVNFSLKNLGSSRQLDKAVAHLSSHESMILQNRRRLLSRISRMQIIEEQMENDGNCLFRAISHQLRGDQSAHLTLRIEALDYILTHNSEYIGVYFPDEAALNVYIAEMSKPGSWGDEIMLKTLCEVKYLITYVLLSTPGTPYLRYQPENLNDEDDCGRIFVSYLSPVHYNSLVFNDESVIRRFSTTFGDTHSYEQSEKEEELLAHNGISPEIDS